MKQNQMNKSKSILALFLLVAFFTNGNSYCQIANKEVDILVENAIKKFNVAGAAVAIVKDGKVIYKKGFGVKSIETKQPVDETTNFAIGSNSKAFTTTALALLVEEGKLSWHDKVKKYIPEFKMYNEYVTENFTIEDLLTHRSGLGLGVGDLMIFPDGSDFKIQDVVSNFQYFKPVSAFRTQFDYDNQLYIVAGEIIARTSGMSWEAFVQKRIMEPLEMNHSYSSQAGMKDKSNLASSHSSESGTITKIATFGDMINGAAGGIFSNVEDMSKWMLVHLNKGNYGKELKATLFSTDSQKEMWKIHTVEDTDANPRYHSHFCGYGLGWELKDVKGNLSVSHTGGVPGMLSIVTMIPDLNLGIVILTNTENGGVGVFSAVSQTIIDSYLGLQDFGWVEKYAAYLNSQKNTGEEVVKKVWETLKAGKNTTIKNEDFIGIYQDKWFGKIEIYQKNKQLWFKSYRSPKLTGQMQFYKANTFAIKWDYQDMNCDAFAMFSLDEEGKAQSIKMKGISPNIDFSFDFQDLDLERIK
jgi:CubicO group peptidase (beta-lactamase class C family)